ncbi:MAG: aminotransferase class I/II-fold pyridoxal phosphate-dependent enzyme, partial [Myxococcales bacterium]|nr:aminotransferase class I/II-fold pyridoxal phosphate-dependent enzyme [Myxococcales bacterium]
PSVCDLYERGIALSGLSKSFGLPGLRERFDTLSLGYTESDGHPHLRAEVAHPYPKIAPDQVLAVIPAEGILVALRAALDAGDHVIALVPAYQSLVEVARLFDCDVTPWPLVLEAEEWHLDLDLLRRSITPRTRLLVINFPHNPTGYLPSPGELEAIVAIAREHGLWLLSDEMYRLLEPSPRQRLPSVCDLYERGIALSGLSKSFGLPGLRVGWLATRDAKLLARCRQVKDYTTLCGSAPSEILALIALRAREAIVARNLAIVQNNLASAADFFAARPDLFRWIPPCAGPVAFPEWRGPLPLSVLCERALAAGVLLVPGDLFAWPGHLRIGLGRRALPEALSALELCLG